MTPLELLVAAAVSLIGMLGTEPAQTSNSSVAIAPGVDLLTIIS